MAELEAEERDREVGGVGGGLGAACSWRIESASSKRDRELGVSEEGGGWCGLFLT